MHRYLYITARLQRYFVMSRFRIMFRVSDRFGNRMTKSQHEITMTASLSLYPSFDKHSMNKIKLSCIPFIRNPSIYCNFEIGKVPADIKQLRRNIAYQGKRALFDSLAHTYRSTDAAADTMRQRDWLVMSVFCERKHSKSGRGPAASAVLRVLLFEMRI